MRGADPSSEPHAKRLLHGVTLLVTNRVLAEATALEPQALRALDAVHVASAQSRRRAHRLRGLDGRQLEAAAALGLPVASPR